MSDLWKFLQIKLEQKIPVALLIVMSCKGSTPGKEGAQMALSLDGDSVGTIGGGTIEYQLTKEVLKQLNNSSQKIHHRRIITEKIGMLCGGEQDIAILFFNQHDVQLIDKISICLQEQSGLLTITPSKIDFNPKNLNTRKYLYKNPQDWLYQHPLNNQIHAYIIGGGHVSLALTKVLNLLDFYITVIDNRPQLALLKNNVYTNEKRFISSYQDIAQHIPNNKNHYVMIMTHSHRSDEQVLEQLLNKNFAYLGMLGSQRKINTLFARLIEKGFSAEKLSKVHAPIGIPITCKTPEEIAISIAAQLIEHKNTSV